MNSSFTSVSTLSSQHDIPLLAKEPSWFQEFRIKVWNAFQILPLESDPNMLNFLQTAILNDFQFNYPPIPVSNPTTALSASKNNKISIIASPTQEELVVPENSIHNPSITYENLYSLINNNSSFIELLNSFIELKIDDKLVAAALATVSWGSYIKIAPDVILEGVVDIKLKNPTPSIQSGLHIIEIGDGSNATIDVTFDSTNNEFDHSVLYIITGINSHVNILIDESGKNGRKTNRGFITKIGKDSTVNFAQVQIDGSYIRQRAQFYFTQEGGDLVEVACLSGRDKQDYDFYSAVYHQTPRCTSKAYARGVNDNDSRTIFKGKVDIGKNGAKVNTDLSLHGLLLSKKAKFHSFPALEVVNNDVMATHGASVSQIDPEQIFYFESRGIDHDTAEYMIASGYFEPAISKIRSNELQARVRSLVSKSVDEQFHRSL